MAISYDADVNVLPGVTNLNPYSTRGVARTARTQQILGLFRLLGFASATVAAVVVYNQESDWALAVFAWIVTAGFVGAGLGVVASHRKKLRRTLYFAVLAAAQVSVAYLTHVWWDRWWLSALLGLVVGTILGGVLITLLFPGIAREQMREQMVAPSR